MIDTKALAQGLVEEAVNLIKEELRWRGVPEEDIEVIADEVEEHLYNARVEI